MSETKRPTALVFAKINRVKRTRKNCKWFLINDTSAEEIERVQLCGSPRRKELKCIGVKCNCYE